MYLCVRPDVSFEKDHYDVNDPHEGNEQKNDADYESDSVLCINSLDDAVDAPYDVQCGNRENDLHEKRKTFELIEKFFHDTVLLCLVINIIYTKYTVFARVFAKF